MMESETGSIGEKSSKNQFSLCEICHSPTATEVDFLIKQEEETPVNSLLLPGAEGCATLFENLRSYFVGRKLLRLSEVECIELLSRETNSMEYRITSPLFTVVCGKCDKIINEALEMHQKVMELQGKIRSLGKTLTEIRGEGTRKEQGQRKIKYSEFVKVEENGEEELNSVEEEFSLSVNATRTKKITTKNRINRPYAARSSTKLSKTYSKEEDGDFEYVPEKHGEAETEDEDFFGADHLGDEWAEEIAFDEGESAEIGSSLIPVMKSRVIKNSEPNSIDENKTTFRYQCPDCFKVFASGTSLRSHTKSIHGYEMRYPCPECPHLKFSQRGLIQHRKQVHDQHICDKCNKKLVNRRSLDRHLELVHKMKLTFPCTLCSRVFRMRRQLISHKSRDHAISTDVLHKLPEREPETEEERMWVENPCQYCGKTYLSGDTFLSHLIHFHERKLDKKEREYSNRIKCFLCWKSFVLEQTRWVHLNLEHKDKVPLEFPCEMCTNVKTTFVNISELEQHLQTEHLTGTSQLLHKCIKCGWPFVDEEQLARHQEVHVNRKPDPEDPDSEKAKHPFKCWFCWEAYQTKEGLMNHLATSRRHQNRKVDFPCDLEQCEYNTSPFQSIDELNNHQNSCHRDKPIHRCSHCSWGFLEKDLLPLHRLNHIYRRQAYYRCPDCEYKSHQLDSLKDHYNHSHGSKLEIHRCPYNNCTKRFTTPGALSLHTGSIHMELLSSSTGIPCEQCGKILRNEKALRLHQRSNHFTRICPDCGMLFTCSTKFYTHRKKLHENPSIDEQKLCPVCGKACRDKATLSRHMLYHGEKKHECNFCGAKFVTMSRAKLHIQKVHENPKKEKMTSFKFHCNQCEKGYSRKDSLDDHIRVQHTKDIRGVWSCPKCGKRFTRKLTRDKHVGNKVCIEKWK